VKAANLFINNLKQNNMKNQIKPFIIYADNNRLHEVGKLCEEAGLLIERNLDGSITYVGGITMHDEFCYYPVDEVGPNRYGFNSGTIDSCGGFETHGLPYFEKFNYPSDLQQIKKHLGLVSQEITGFGVKGSPSLLKAFAEEAVGLGWIEQSNNTSSPDLYFNVTKDVDYGSLKKGHFWVSNAGSSTVTGPNFNLPSQWNEAVECLQLINKPKVLEVTLQQVADKFGVELSNLKIII
jgi:hypothetical protein